MKRENLICNFMSSNEDKTRLKQEGLLAALIYSKNFASKQ